MKMKLDERKKGKSCCSDIYFQYVVQHYNINTYKISFKYRTFLHSKFDIWMSVFQLQLYLYKRMELNTIINLLTLLR